MIAKGNLHGDGAKLAAYLITGKDGERAELVELRGFAAGNIRDAFADVEIQAEATHATRPFFHAYVRLPDGEALDRDQWQHVADRIERRLGFADQPRAVAFHHLPDGATHMHVAWSRIDTEQMRAIDPGLYKLKLKEISRELECELGLTRVRNERDPADKTLAPGRSEFEQARRLDTDLKGIRNAIRECWEQSDSGRSFAAALDMHGLILARGDRRDFVIIDLAGGDHALSKRITGATAGETRARMTDIDRQQLPSVDAAKELQAERAEREARAGAWPMPERSSTSIDLAAALERSGDIRAEFMTALAATTAPEPVQTHERPAASFAPEQQRLAATARQSAPEMLEIGAAGGRVIGGFFGGVARAVEKVFDFFADMIAPAPPPTKDQAERMVRAADERHEETATAQQTAEKDARLQETLDQMARDDTQRRYDRWTGRALNDPERDRDDDYSRGRERER